LRNGGLRILRDDALLHVVRQRRHLGLVVRRRAPLPLAVQRPDSPGEPRRLLDGRGRRRIGVHRGQRQLRHDPRWPRGNGELWVVHRAADVRRWRHSQPVRMHSQDVPRGCPG
jgi:hypothetical protein